MYQKKTADSHMCNFCVLFLKSLQTFMVRKTTFFWEKKNKINQINHLSFFSALHTMILRMQFSKT